MTYILLIYLNEETISEATREKCYLDSAQLAHQIKASGQYLDAAPLHPTLTATCVRVRDGKRIIIDGPFAETREQLGGYFLINSKDLDEAINIAFQIPGACLGTIEIRPVMKIAGSTQE